MNFLKSLYRKPKNISRVILDSGARHVDVQGEATVTETGDTGTNKTAIKPEKFTGIGKFASSEGVPRGARSRAGFEGIF